MNIFKPIKDLNYKELSTNVVIPADILKDILDSHIPLKISKNERSTWENKINVIIKSYKEYTRIVCGDLNGMETPYDIKKKGWKTHERKWNQFKKKIQKINKDLPLYCVHY